MAYIGNTVQNQGFAPAIDYFSGNGVTVTFTLSRPLASVAQIICAIDNVIQNPSSAFTVSGNSITFTSAPLSGTNNIWVEYTSLITTYAAISQDPSVIGDITASGGYLSTGDFGNSYIDGIVVDYVTGNARLTTGPVDGMTFYNGGTSARNALMTLDSSGNMGVNTTPSSWNAAYKAIQNGNVTLLGTASGAEGYMWTNVYYDQSGTNKYIINGPALRYDQSGGAHKWFAASTGTAGTAVTSTNVLEVTKDRTLALQGGGSVAGTGLSFPAAQNASSDPNTLDDYEEGTWTPVLTFGGGSTGITYSSRTALYTKVGNTVYVAVDIVLTNKGSSTGSVWITGLPFAYNSSLNNVYTMPCLLTSTATSVGTLVAGVYLSNIYLYNTISTGYTNLQNTAFSNGSELTICGTYLTQT